MMAIFNVRFECRQIREVLVYADSVEEAKANFEASRDVQWDSLICEDDGSEALVVTHVLKLTEE